MKRLGMFGMIQELISFRFETHCWPTFFLCLLYTIPSFRLSNRGPQERKNECVSLNTTNAALPGPADSMLQSTILPDSPPHDDNIPQHQLLVYFVKTVPHPHDNQGGVGSILRTRYGIPFSLLFSVLHFFLGAEPKLLEMRIFFAFSDSDLVVVHMSLKT